MVQVVLVVLKALCLLVVGSTFSLLSLCSCGSCGSCYSWGSVSTECPVSPCCPGSLFCPLSLGCLLSPHSPFVPLAPCGPAILFDPHLYQVSVCLPVLLIPLFLIYLSVQPFLKSGISLFTILTICSIPCTPLLHDFFDSHAVSFTVWSRCMDIDLPTLNSFTQILVYLCHKTIAV